MVWLSRWKFRRASASLCVSLMFVFSLSAAANAVNRIQHAAGVPHQHGLFSELLPQDHHDADHQGSAYHHHGAGHDHDAAAAHHHVHGGDQHGDAGLTADQDSTHAQGGVHHHGDTGASMAVLTVLPSGLLQHSGHWRNPAFVRFTLSVRQSLPERPPRTSPSII